MSEPTFKKVSLKEEKKIKNGINYTSGRHICCYFCVVTANIFVC